MSTQYENSYKITLDTNRTLHTYVFENQSETYQTHKSIKLTQEQYSDIVNKVESLGEFDEKTDSAAYDYWTVNLNINSNNYCFTYGLSKNKNYDNLISDIIKLSAIEIVDSNGDSVVPF